MLSVFPEYRCDTGREFSLAASSRLNTDACLKIVARTEDGIRRRENADPNAAVFRCAGEVCTNCVTSQRCGLKLVYRDVHDAAGLLVSE